MKHLAALIIAGLLLGSLAGATFVQSQKSLGEHKVHKYPYSYLETLLNKQDKTAILIYSYGSLLDTGSAERTFSGEALKTRKLAVAIGTKRVFNRDVPLKPGQKWKLPCHNLARGMLNIELTESDNDVTNGVIMMVPIDDINAMRSREEGYDLVPVIVALWDDYSNNKNSDYKIAYTFHARDDTPYTNSHIYPRPGYYELSRDAAKRQGAAFFDMWMNSTYLSDKRSPIAVWEEAVKTCREFTLICQKRYLCR